MTAGHPIAPWERVTIPPGDRHPVLQSERVTG